MNQPCGGSNNGSTVNLISQLLNASANDGTSRGVATGGGGCPMGGNSGSSDQSSAVGGQNNHNDLANNLIFLLQNLMGSYK